MAYIALKPVRFSRNYAIDEIIPDYEVSPAREKNLIAMGMITKVSETTREPSGNDPNSSGDSDSGQNITNPDNGNGDDLDAGETPPNDEESSEPEPARKTRKK